MNSLNSTRVSTTLQLDEQIKQTKQIKQKVPCKNKHFSQTVRNLYTAVDCLFGFRIGPWTFSCLTILMESQIVTSLLYCFALCQTEDTNRLIV